MQTSVSGSDPILNAERGHPRRWAILAVMSLSIFMLTMDNTIVNTALPAMARDLQASTQLMQWIVDGYVLALAGLLLVGGSIGDLFGRRRWFAIGMVIFGIASVGAALAASAGQLVAFRVLQGVGGALVMPATLSIITNAFPRSERAQAIGIWTGVGALAMGAGPAVGGLLVDHGGWASIFWMHVPLVLLALGGLLVVPESRDLRPRRLDISGAAVATLGLTALVYGIISAGEHGLSDTQVVAPLLIAGLALAGFVRIELRSSAPMLPLRFFRQRDFAAGVVIVGVVFFAIAVVFFFLTQFYQLVQGRSAFEAGLLALPSAAAMMVGAPLSGLLVHRVGPRVLITAAVTSVAIAVALLARINPDTGALEVVGYLLLFGLAGGLGMAPLTDMVMAAVPEQDAGIGSAMNDVSRELGAALGIAAIGSFVSAHYRAGVDGAFGTSLPATALDEIREGIGVAAVVTPSLPSEVQASAAALTHQAFVDAFTSGFVVSAILLAVTAALAMFVVPRRTRSEQATAIGADVAHDSTAAEAPARVAEPVAPFEARCFVALGCQRDRRPGAC